MGNGYTGNAQFAWGDLFKVGSTYHMYPSQGPGVTVHCQSTDLFHWTDQFGGTVSFDALTTDDPSGIGTGVALLKEADGITPIIVDNKYWMIYFHGFSGGSMYMAYTDAAGDLLTWTTCYAGSPVLIPSGWEGGSLWTPSFVGVNDTYYIYYQAGSPYRIGFASGPASSGGSPVRPDNTTWTKSPNNPVITNIHGWDNGFCQDPVLRCFDGVYYLFYTGDPPWTNGFAYSDSPEGPWTQYGATPGGSTVWTKVGSPSVTIGIISFSSGQGIQSPGTFSPGSALGFRANYVGGNTYKWVGFLDGNVPPFTYIGVAQTVGTNLILTNYITTRDWSTIGSITNSYHIYEHAWLSGETRSYLDHSSTPVTVSTQVPSGPLPVNVRNYNDNTYGLEVDWIYVREYNDPEPISTVDPEQAFPGIWTGAVDNDWHNTDNWSDNVVPTSSDDVTIRGGLTNYPTLSAAGTCNDITFGSNSSGTASLLDNGFLTVDGSANLDRILTEDKWHYISSPVDDPLAGVFLGLYMMLWDEPSGLWTYITDPGYTLTTDMQGFGIWTNDPTTVTFTGDLNTGPRTFSTTNTSGAAHNNKGFNFTGNPYPSSLDWDVNDGSGWSRTSGNIDMSLYIWNGTVGNYGAYVKGSGSGTNDVDNIIPPHQGFFVHCLAATGSIGVDNGARIHASQDILKSTENYVDAFLKLRATGNNYADEILFQVNEQASANYDNFFDAMKFRGDEGAPQLYSLSIDEKELSVNSFARSEDYLVIPLGLEVGAVGQYSISVETLTGFDPDEDLYLEDLETGIITKLDAASVYEFSASPEDEPIRFIFHLEGEMAVPDHLDDLINIYSMNTSICVELPEEIDGKIVVYNLMGQMVANVDIWNSKTIIPLENSNCYIVKVIGDKNVVSRKIIVK